MAELGNLTGGILLSLRRMSTVKIRAGSLFRTPLVPDWFSGAGFGGDPEISDQWLVVRGRQWPMIQEPAWPMALLSFTDH
jgi:hypothetical protein